MEKKPDLAGAELEVMKVLWKKGKATVKEVQDVLSPKKSWQYTTVMTLLVRMYNKGYLDRQKVGWGYVYTPKVPKEKIMGGMVKKFIDRVFDGALGPLVNYLAESQKLDPKEMESLKKLAMNLEKKENNK